MGQEMGMGADADAKAISFLKKVEEITAIEYDLPSILTSLVVVDMQRGKKLSRPVELQRDLTDLLEDPKAAILFKAHYGLISREDCLRDNVDASETASTQALQATRCTSTIMPGGQSVLSYVNMKYDLKSDLKEFQSALSRFTRIARQQLLMRDSIDTRDREILLNLFQAAATHASSVGESYFAEGYFTLLQHDSALVGPGAMKQTLE
jgi:hypothetical protein